MKKPTRLKIPTSVALISVCMSGVALAEDTEWEIKSGDMLSKVVAKVYPDYSGRQAIMQEIFKRNPDAFAGDINQLIVGKILKLPDAEEIPELLKAEPEPVAQEPEPEVAAEKIQDLQAEIVALKEKNSSLQEKLQALDNEKQQVTDSPGQGASRAGGAADDKLAELQETIELLEEENSGYQDMLKVYEEEKQALNSELEKLKAVSPSQATDSQVRQGVEPADDSKLAELQETIALLEDENASLQEMLKGYAEAAQATAPAQQGDGADTPIPQTEVGDDPVAELKETIALLEDENASLQDMLKGYVESAESGAALSGGQPQTAQEDIAALQTQLNEARLENENLANDLQQLRAAMALAEDRASGSGVLPWVLLGLMGLLTLPLIWLLRRKQDDDLVSTVPAQSAAPAAATASVQTREVAAVASSAGAAADNTGVAATGESDEITQDDNEDAELKLDIARAYLDLRDSESAADILQDVLSEGGARQQQEAREILSFIA